MSPSDLVTVYYFLDAVADNDASTVSCFKATREAIAAVWGGQPLEGTAETVPVDWLDDQGRYRRVATGWGELDETAVPANAQVAEPPTVPRGTPAV